jgi:hypothetical protein
MATTTTTAFGGDYYGDAAVVGLDCEMVGGGRGGKFSMLARCSVVTLVDRVPDVGRRDDDDVGRDEDDDDDDDDDDGAALGRGEMVGATTTAEDDDGSSNDEPPRGEKKEPTTTTTIGGGGGRLDEGLVVLYDKYVVPRGRVTDYRTEWSGITKDTYNNNNNNDREGSSSSSGGGGGGGSPAIPIVSFDQCRNEVSRLLSSIGGKRVVVVGVSKESQVRSEEGHCVIVCPCAPSSFCPFFLFTYVPFIIIISLTHRPAATLSMPWKTISRRLR